MKKFYLLIALGMMISLASGAVAQNQGKHGLRGRIISVTGNNIVVRSHTTDGKQEVTVTVDANTTVTIDGKPSRASDLHRGLFVRVTPSEGTAVVVKASTSRPQGLHKKTASTTAPAAN